MELTAENRSLSTVQRVLAILLRGGFLLLVFSLGFMWPSVWVSRFSIPITDFIFPVVVFTWLVALAVGAIRFRWTRYYYVVLLFWIACALSTAVSTDIHRSLVKLAGETYLVGLSILTLNLVTNSSAIRGFFYSWLAAMAVGCAVSILSLVLFYADRTNVVLSFTLSHYGTLPPGNYPRISSTFLNPNMFCNYLNVGIMFLLAADKLDWIPRVLFYLLLLLLCAAVALTISPGIGGVLLSGGIWYWAYFREKEKYASARLWLLAGSLAAAIFFVSILLAPTANALAEFQFEPANGVHLYSSERVSAWMAAAKTFAAHPLTGIGLGLDSGVASSIGPDGAVHSVSDAHQIWLNFAAQTGLVGFSAMLILVVYVVKKSQPLAFGNDRASILRVAAGCAFLGAFLFQGLAGSFEDARHLWVLIGFVVAAGSQKAEAAELS